MISVETALKYSCTNMVCIFYISTECVHCLKPNISKFCIYRVDPVNISFRYKGSICDELDLQGFQ